MTSLRGRRNVRSASTMCRKRILSDSLKTGVRSGSSTNALRNRSSEQGRYCARKGFYDLHFDVSENAGAARFNEAQLGEAAFVQLDGDYEQVLCKLNAISVGDSFPGDLRVRAIFFLCIQRLRTCEARDEAISALTAVHTEAAKVQHGEQFPTCS